GGRWSWRWRRRRPSPTVAARCTPPRGTASERRGGRRSTARHLPARARGGAARSSAGVAPKEAGRMTVRFSEEERGIVLRTLKARLDALQTEMTQTDTPEFSIRLKHEEDIIQGLIERLDSAAASRRPARRGGSAGGRPRTRTGKRRR